MKLENIRIQNFRSFKDQTIYFDDYTCLVGPNGAGKSAVLMALNVFFRNNESTVTDMVNLSKEDFHHQNISEPIKITLTFINLSEEAKEEMKHYYRQNKLIISAEAEWDEVTQQANVKQHGSRSVMKEFSSYFKMLNEGSLASPLKDEYDRLRTSRPDIPTATTKDGRTKVLREYEESHPELCETLKEECQFYGFSRGKDKLDKYLQWVYIPAVKDASSEQEESNKTALGQLLQRTVRAKIDFKSSLEVIDELIQKRYNELLEKEKKVLKDLGLSIQERLREWTNPRAALELEWQGEPAKLKEPIAKAKVGDDSFLGEIARLGHGMQRGFLVAILKELVDNNQKGGPKLLLGFEEPELYQHPPQAQHMQSVLERLAEPDNNSQVIITSHSPYFVSSKGFPYIRMFSKSGKNPYSIVKSTDYEKVEKRITEAFGKETKSPTSLMAVIGQIMHTSQKEMFFSPVIVLVEGVEDIAYISTHLQLTGEWKTFRRNGCHFVLTDGKNNMPRFLAITKELNIPTFVVCDSDIESCIKNIENKEKLSKDSPGRQDKIRNAKNTLERQKELNKAISRLCGIEIEEPFKSETIKTGQMIMWKDSIEKEVKNSFQETEWQDAQDEIVEEYGFERVSSKQKNSMVIAATLEKLHLGGKQSPVLIDLCGRISIYAQKTSRGI